MKKPKGMSFHFCRLCERITIICSCGNNLCNGSTGEMVCENGCDCEKAYEYENYIYKKSKIILPLLNGILSFFLKDKPWTADKIDKSSLEKE